MRSQGRGVGAEHSKRAPGPFPTAIFALQPSFALSPSCRLLLLGAGHAAASMPIYGAGGYGRAQPKFRQRSDSEIEEEKRLKDMKKMTKSKTDHDLLKGAGEAGRECS